MRRLFVVLLLAAGANGASVPDAGIAAEDTLPVQNMTATPGKPLPLTLKAPAEGAAGVRFVMVRGAPEGVTFTAGFRVKGTWLIAAKDLARTQLITPAQLDTGFSLEFIFFKVSGAAPVGRSLLKVQLDRVHASDTAQASQGGQTLTAVSRVDDFDFAPQPPKELVVFTPAQETEMLKRGERYMELGDVASARLLYEDLAAHGSAKGALAMGKSYDPAVLKEIFVAGTMEPDAKTARLWYRRAQDMGEASAAKYLTALTP